MEDSKSIIRQNLIKINPIYDNHHSFSRSLKSHSYQQKFLLKLKNKGGNYDTA